MHTLGDRHRLDENLLLRERRRSRSPLTRCAAGMFSEYASRLIHAQQSYSRTLSGPHRPLFHSTHDDREDMRESIALRQSRAGVGSRFGAFRPTTADYEEEEYEDNEHDAMRSSWVPPPDRKRVNMRPDPDLGPATSDLVGLTESFSPSGQTIPLDQDQEGIDDDDDATTQGSRAPDDIMFGVSLDESLPPRSLVGSPAPMPSGVGLADSLQGDEPDVHIPIALLEPDIGAVQHDRGFAVLFMFCQALIVSTSIFVYLTTDEPATPMTDSVYRALSSSMGTIVRDIGLALVISATWLAAMRLAVRPLLYTIVVAVPISVVIMGSYILTWSYKGSQGGYELQARAMRWSSLFMFCFSAMWIQTAYKRRFAMRKAVSIVRLACAILEQNSTLLLVGLGSLLIFVTYSLVWFHQFERIFLRGVFVGIGSTRRWLTQGSSWFMGAGFVIMYLWSFGVVSGVQRATTSAAVSHWYFHRHDLLKVSQKDVTNAAMLHALSTSFGSICASSFFALLTRLPLIALPRRLSGLLSLGAYMLLSAPILSLTNPLTLSYAAIHSINLSVAAKSISQEPVFNPASSWAAFRTAKMLLSAARATTALALGTAAWVASARAADESATLYGYIVALAASVVGWAVVGSIEGIVSIVVDASFVCYGIDLSSSREGRSHCLEAVNAFGSVSVGRNGGALQV